MRQTLRGAWMLAVSILAVACSSPSGPDAAERNPDDELLPQNRGTELMSGSDLSINSRIRWEDPLDIVFTGSGGVRSVSVLDRLSRSIGSARAGESLSYDLGVSDDGRAAYFSAESRTLDENRVFPISLYHAAPGGAAVQLTAQGVRGGPHKHSASGSPFLPTRDSRRAAYIVKPDSIRMYDVATRTSSPLSRGCSGLLAFSPAGDELLCKASAGMFVVTLATGATRALALPAGRQSSNLQSLHWGSLGLRFVFDQIGNNGGADLVDAASGSVKPLTSLAGLAFLESSYYQRTAWSRDGRKVAFSTRFLGNFLSGRHQFGIYVTDVETLQTLRVGVVHIEQPKDGSFVDVDQLTFSPDGRRLAYLAGSYSAASIYIVDLP